MKDRYLQLCAWLDENIALSRDLLSLLNAERIALIAFDGDKLAENTMAKEMVVAKISLTRKHLREGAQSWFSCQDSAGLEAKLPQDLAKDWKAKRQEWLSVWKQACEQTQRNQEFLKHSQRNLTRLIDNWRRLVGEAPLYSAKGQKVEASTTGKVFEAKF